MEIEDKKELLVRIEKALDSIRPHLHADGGDIEVIDVTDDMEVKVKWLGNCKNCGLSNMTLKSGVEQAIKSSIAGVTSVSTVDFQEELHES